MSKGRIRNRRLGDVRFLKGVPGWSWTPFLIDFRGSGEALGDHLRALGFVLGAPGATLRGL